MTRYRNCPDCNNKFILPKSTKQFLIKHPLTKIECPNCGCDCTYPISKGDYVKRSWIENEKNKNIGK